MANFPVALLADDFTNGVIDSLWTTAFTVSGSATRAETGGQFVVTLPSSTAGTHQAGIQSAANYDLTSDQVTINVGTMVSTSVAATAALTLFDNADPTYWVRIAQLSGNLNFQKSVAGVISTTGTAVTWNASTHKYWRIREFTGTIYFDTSSNGTSWTNRGSVTTGSSFVPTAVLVRVDAVCGNVASPGQFKIDELNGIYPAPSSTWRYTTADWSITNRLRPVTLAATVNTIGAIVTADTMDAAGVLGGTVRYFAGPLGSSSGGYLALTEYASLSLAQASAFGVPIDGRVDLPAFVDARFVRLYHRSSDASTHTIYEYVPRRIVQSDDIEAENVRTINLAAGAVTADKIFVLELAALAADMGTLHMTGVIDIESTGGIYQGTGTFASPTTGLKLFNSGGVGKLSGYNTGVEQVSFDTDGKLRAGGGAVWLDQLGVNLSGESSFVAPGAHTKNTIRFDAASTTPGIIWGYVAGSDSAVIIETSDAVGVGDDAKIRLMHRTIANSIRAELMIDGDGVEISGVNGGLSVGTTGAGAGQIATSGSVGLGVAPAAVTRLKIQSSGTTSASSIISGYNSAATLHFYVLSDATGFLNNTAWTYSSDATRKRNIRPLNKDIRDFMQLEPKMFDYIDGPNNRAGYIAQEVQAIYPELVETLPDGTLGMRTDELLPLFNHVLRRLIRILIQKGVIGQGDIA
jgi:hypothetical protein